MKRRRLLSLFMVLGVSIQVSGCVSKEEKRVLQESVTENMIELSSNGGKEIKSEVIELGLDEGDYFTPSYYENGEIYGYIGWGVGSARNSYEIMRKKYPVYDRAKTNLYKIGKDNKLEETSIGAENAFNALDDELNNVIDQLKQKYNVRMIGGIDYLNERYTSIAIDIGIGKSKYKNFIYDRESKRIYRDEYDEIKYTVGNNVFKYIESIDSIIYVDETLTCYKVKLEEDTYSLKKYSSFGKIDVLERCAISEVNDQEVLITKYKKILKGGGYEHHYLEEITSICKYDFSTNQLTTLFEKQEGTTVYGYYVGKNIYIIEEFKVQEKNILPLKRYFYEVKEDGMKIILEENIENEGERNHPGALAKVSEDGKEIFMTIYITEWYTWNKNDNITVDAIYKKYRLEDDDI